MLGWWNIAIRAIGALIMLFLLTRILGKKQISQLTFFEYITGIVIGDLAGFMSTDIEADYMHGVTAMLVWLTIPLLAETLSLKSKKARILLDGRGTVFIQEGKVLEENLAKERYTADELLEQLRTKSVFDPTEVQYAILESSGELSVLLKEEFRPLTPITRNKDPVKTKPPRAVVMDGTIQDEGLKSLGYDRVWLDRKLQKAGRRVNEVFLAVADDQGSMYLDFYEDHVKDTPQRRVRRRKR